MAQVRPMRADARRNYERLLRVAAVAFAEYGEGASLDDVAKKAGVGSGTLYRHFPTRRALLEAVYVDSIEAIAARADALAAELPAGEALVEWLNELSLSMIRLRGLKAVLGDAVLGDEVAGDGVLGDEVAGDGVLGDAVGGSSVGVPAVRAVRAVCGTSVTAAATRLVGAAQAAGALRGDVLPVEVLRLAHGVAAASELADGEGKHIRRYLTLLTEGLRA
ncbi:TetR/AcrR family transcriptional regulator [Streptomyces sp. NPDC127072]|uniref:TetR/AcrR family transcriptional regulator n=1 Tax=Streptomyces sp. NPDC127072 TaxID=3347129 RepID=UPI0036695384